MAKAPAPPPIGKDWVPPTKIMIVAWTAVATLGLTLAVTQRDKTEQYCFELAEPLE